MIIERRFFGAEVREMDDTPMRIIGYAAVFNSLSEEMFGFREKIAPGAFADAIKCDDVRCLFNHDENNIIGRMCAKTLRLSEDERGLRYENDLPDTHVGQHVRSAIKRGDITGNSFAFSLRNPDGERWERVADGSYVRTLLRLKLYDVGPVTYPAYPDTSVDVREVREMYAAKIAAIKPPPVIVDMAAHRIRQWIAENT